MVSSSVNRKNIIHIKIKLDLITSMEIIQYMRRTNI